MHLFWLLLIFGTVGTIVSSFSSITRDDQPSLPKVILFNDTALFDQNELLLIKRLFEPQSDLYMQIHSSQLTHILQEYDIFQTINTLYIIPPFNMSAVSNIMHVTNPPYMQHIQELQSVIRQVISQIFPTNPAPPLILVRSASDTDLENDMLEIIYNSIDSELCTIRDYPYDVVNSIRHQSHELIITFGSKLHDILSHAYLINMLHDLSLQQTYIIIPNMHDALKAFFSQQSHILLLINPFETGFMDKNYLPQFNVDEIKQQLDQITDDDLYFDTKFPKHIIVLHSETQYWHFMDLQKIINSQPRFNMYGNSFRFSVQIASSIIEINNLIKKIKRQQHRMQINEINHYAELKNSLSAMSVYGSENITNTSGIDWIPISAEMQESDVDSDFVNQTKSEIDIFEQEQIIHSPVAHGRADTLFKPLMAEHEMWQNNIVVDADDLSYLTNMSELLIEEDPKETETLYSESRKSNGIMLFVCVIIVIVIALLMGAVCYRLNAKSADLEFTIKQNMTEIEGERCADKILHSISVHRRRISWGKQSNPTPTDSVQCVVETNL